ncbi:non-canonical purine NTP pyrophosphatase [Fusobacterium sp. MFO224]|uniref:non-canonical purine NTP pyrophosphatase n=1 Tax=Fusobacterium sp. MFO224 TaxID=3378070 RepID=UPI0038550548
MKVYFMSKNKRKIKDAQKAANLLELKMEVFRIDYDIEEIQSENDEKLVKDKVIKAFKILRRPVCVEQTGLYIEEFGNLPGGLTSIVWDNLGVENFCKFFGREKNKVLMKSIVGYCDGKNVEIFSGECYGTISTEPTGTREERLDRVFIPKGYNRTLSDLGEEKNNISARITAFKKFFNYLEGEANG